MFFNCGETVIRKDFDNNNESERKDSKILPLLFFGAAFFALLALVSYSPEDVNFIYGGTTAPPVNWIGPAGAKFSWYMLLNFGLVSYLAVFAILLRTIRLFFPEPGRFSRPVIFNRNKIIRRKVAAAFRKNETNIK